MEARGRMILWAIEVEVCLCIAASEAMALDLLDEMMARTF